MAQDGDRLASGEKVHRKERKEKQEKKREGNKNGPVGPFLVRLAVN